MFERHKARALACAALLALAALAHAPRAAAQTPEPPRRPHGPVAGPVIKLPPGAGAADERTQAQSARDDEPARPAWSPQRWEYCVIKGFKYHQKGFSISSPTHVPAAYVRYFPSGTEEIEGANEDEALANAFAKLGEDGWELTGVRTDLSLSDGNGASTAVYFFKRPRKPE
ncbi:MAG TPA: hypothetical protein VF659_00955 [Pyrinomonadaceae bacterium]|jgi:hypothetical protein